jgi:hypothetical protein
MDFNLLENRIAEECPFFKSTYDVPNFWSVIIETINGEYSENTKKIIIKLENVVRETKKRLQPKSIDFDRLNPNQQYLECRDTFLTLIVNILERIKRESKTFRDILENKYVLKTFLQYMAEKYINKSKKYDNNYNDENEEYFDAKSDNDNEEYFDAKSKGGKSNNKSKSKSNNKSKRKSKSNRNKNIAKK